MCFCVAAIGLASATTGPWYKTFFGHYAATLRYIQYGQATPGINDIYAGQIGGFIKTEDVRLATLAPAEETRGAYGLEWTFFGARFLPLPSGGQPSFYAMTYMGSNAAFHGAGYDALISPADIAGAIGTSPQTVTELATLSAHVAAFGYEDFNRSGHHAPLSWNSKDIDADGMGDFTLGGLIYLSTTGFTTPLAVRGRAAEHVFIDTEEGVRIVRLLAGRLSVAGYDPAKGLRDLATPIEIHDVAVNAGHALTSAPARNGDLILVRRACGLQIYRYGAGVVAPGPCITGLTGSWAMPGAAGDFDGDGEPDFWISQTDQGNRSAPSTGHVRLISGRSLAAATGEVPIDSLTIAKMRGSAAYSNYDGICTTLSPVAGDFDNDGKPDLTCSGHRHMNEAGAMYLLRGADISQGMDITIEDSRVIKVAGPMMSQLAPPFHHWDATDFDGDGYDDIAVSADNDVYAGINAGAVYLLSGKAIAESQPAASSSR
ncbi:hypothetical protein AWJ14_02425 [Hoeflea olei]|uniref:Uncharacterized protein n=1 Tax=Hoeflea olei TaxID=1480615 RepID=A0A1C1YVX4_9HYPH|nr:hypothetical protein AWJ14_02425 [Hoeflea olei]